MSSDVYIVSVVPFMSDVSIVCAASAISFALVRCVWCHLKLVWEGVQKKISFLVVFYY